MQVPQVSLNKLLVICGPTGVGKTIFGMDLARKVGGEIISADSRQVYRGMDIGTGKDIPEGASFKETHIKLQAERIGYYEYNGVKIWGLDLVDPWQDFSVSQYTKIAKKIFEVVWNEGSLPILVGGTGLYIKAVIDGIDTLEIPPNIGLRKSVEDKNWEELFDILARMDPIRAGSMNISDRKNPRRLIRAIEVAEAKGKYKGVDRGIKPDILLIGLTAPKEFIKERIAKRLAKRVNQGLLAEVKRLVKTGLSWDTQAMTGLGYRQWELYLKGAKTKDQVLSEWEKAEFGYAKRQLTWFRRDKRIRWFDVTEDAWQEKVERMVKKWYSQI